MDARLLEQATALIQISRVYKIYTDENKAVLEGTQSELCDLYTKILQLPIDSDISGKFQICGYELDTTKMWWWKQNPFRNVWYQYYIGGSCLDIFQSEANKKPCELRTQLVIHW